MAELEYGKTPVEPEFWFKKAGLYHSEDYRFKEHDTTHGSGTYRENIQSVIFPKNTIDVYCPSCRRETVFNPVKRKDDWYDSGYEIIPTGVQYAHFRCSRSECGSDLFFVFRITGEAVTKIGQSPSIADLLSPDIKKYSAMLDSSLIVDWQRAIGLKAHGIGAGSYVYLRRIIENMVNDAYTVALKDKKIDPETYSKARWPEKIKMLPGYLPNYLVNNAKVYSVLSIGVHELSEEECMDYFDVMHTSIEIICEEKLAELQRNKKAKKGAKALQKVLKQISEK